METKTLKNIDFKNLTFWGNFTCHKDARGLFPLVHFCVPPPSVHVLIFPEEIRLPFKG